MFWDDCSFMGLVSRNTAPAAPLQIQRYLTLNKQQE